MSNFSLIGHTLPVSVVRFSPNGQSLASAGADYAVRLWSLPSLSSQGIYQQSITNTTSSILSSSVIQTTVPQVTSIRTSKNLEGHTQGVSDVSWSPDGTLLASGSDDGTIRLWDVIEGRTACKPFRGHVNHVMCLHFCPRANIIASGSFDESVRLWDLRSGKCFRTIQAHSEPITNVQFHADGSTLATSSFDGLVRLWDHSSGQCLKTLQAEGTPPVGSFKFSPNGKFLICATLDAKVRLWDYVSGRRLKTYSGHTNSNLCMGLSFVTRKGRDNILSVKDLGKMDIEANNETKDGTGDSISGDVTNEMSSNKDNQPLIASGSEDGCVFFWDTQTKSIVKTLSGHTGPVVALDSNNNGLIASSGGEDASIKVWDL
jgi:COMPASS component SWD3